MKYIAVQLKANTFMPRSILSLLLLTFVFWITSCSDNNQTSKSSVPDLSTKTKVKTVPLMGSWEMQEILQ